MTGHEPPVAEGSRQWREHPVDDAIAIDVDQCPILRIATRGSLISQRDGPSRYSPDVLSERIVELTNRARGLAGEVAAVGRLTRDLPRFYTNQLTLEDAEAWHRSRLARREDMFLRVVERQIYAFGGSPYRALLRAAGCELGDLHRLVAERGLVGALERLDELGVYVTYDEFRGRRPAVRGSQTFHFADHDFNNPLARVHYGMLTGGTRGQRARVPRSLEFAVEAGNTMVVALAANGLLRTSHALWATAPLNHLIRLPKHGTPVAAWFSPLAPLPWTVLVGALYLAALVRIAGRRIPLPRHGDLQDPTRVVEWLGSRCARGEHTCMVCTVSAAVRAAGLAVERGMSLRGTTFFVRSEPFTAVRKRAIEASGARAIVNYGTTEVSLIGISCARPDAPDDVHVFESRYALTQRRRPPIEGAATIQALALTSLSDDVPKTLLNTETGDMGDVVRRDGQCCALGGLGLTLHLSNIRSFEKLSSEGVTFTASNLTTVIEEVLPARFGGTSVDYQLVEAERADGLGELSLLVSPDLGSVDEAQIRAEFLRALTVGGLQEEYHARMLDRLESIRIRRQRPHITAAGKTLALHLLRADGDPGRQSARRAT
jgi:hypothetical protein